MLKDFENYVPNETHPLARDMNTAGQMVKILNNTSGADVFVDATGIHFRQRPIPAVEEEDAPEYYGQVHMGTANLTAGWSLLPLVNITP